MSENPREYETSLEDGFAPDERMVNAKGTIIWFGDVTPTAFVLKVFASI
eukprot:CAMPEP_0185792744 /NCGR_PEP_ID=MMETSP1174-20130828/159099_1 /TAXON_ID=35687 /ORGANISM="Dictyocha speculum, Strain CCMP1381" /LENGTH=48 /DNA_ID= /DNA_START= /DNA_END= /DNA_ORIENTATION=